MPVPPAPHLLTTRTAALLMVALLTSACLPGLRRGDEPATMQGFSPATPALAEQGQGASAVIDALRARQSVLPPSGPFRTVAEAVLQGSSGASEAELRMARLKAEAQSKNWLPSIGPTVSLTSLGAVVGQIVLEQALLDNGRRKAERDHAAADVEVAAVGLVEDMTARVHDGLRAYVSAERARAQAGVAERAVARLAEYEGIVTLRLQGGLSDRSEQQMISQKRAEMQATLAADRQAAVQALADLAALTRQPMDGLAGLDLLPPDAGMPEPLSVLRARAEGSRALAEARMARAGLLPGLTASVGMDQTGEVSPGLTLGGARLGLGNIAQARALDGTPELVERRTAQAQEDSARQITSLNSDLAALRLRQAQGAEVLRQTQSNLSLFVEQYRLGGRSLLELVGQYDSAARLERDQVSLTYEIALVQLRLAAARGLLVDGARM
jgi:adhesin transport system outer membrane protein